MIRATPVGMQILPTLDERCPGGEEATVRGQPRWRERSLILHQSPAGCKGSVRACKNLRIAVDAGEHKRAQHGYMRRQNDRYDFALTCVAIIAQMPARSASGSDGQASMTAASSG